MLSEKVVVSFQCGVIPLNKNEQFQTASEFVRFSPPAFFSVNVCIYCHSNTPGYWYGLAEVFKNCHIVQKSEFSFQKLVLGAVA